MPTVVADTTPARLVDAVEVLRLVADPTRARILDLLAAESLCVCHLQDALGAKQTLVSHHLRALREGGLIEAEPHGRFTYYRLRPDALEQAAAALSASARQAVTPPPRRAC